MVPMPAPQAHRSLGTFSNAHDFAERDVFVPFRACRSPTHSVFVCVCPGEQSAPVFHWHSFCLLQLPETSVRDPAAGNENVPQRPPTTGSRTDSSCCDLRPSCCLHGGHTALRTAQSSDSKAACSWVTQDSPICQLSLQDFLAPWIDLCKAN